MPLPMSLNATCLLLAALLAAATGLTAPAPARAEAMHEAHFDFVLRGIRAGSLTFRAAENARNYSVAGRLETSGLVGAIRRIRYDARAQGARNGSGSFTPARYEEDADTGRRQSQSVMDYRAGVPQVRVTVPAREPDPKDVNPATQGGTVDPLTALFATLRPVSADQACDSRLRLFDGRRASALNLGPAQRNGDTIVCDGEYLRIAGFTEREMAERTRFPFRLTYAPAGESMVQVVEVTMDSLYGRAALKRR